MDQKKIGQFLRELRKEQNLTQEELAEKFLISSRSVSRWETGANLPDISMLVELADFYNVDIREIIDGERKNEEMDNETRETLTKVAEYADQEMEKVKKRMANACAAALILVAFSVLLAATEGFGGRIPARPVENMRDFTEGLCMGVLIVNILFLSGRMERFRQFKKRLFSRN